MHVDLITSKSQIMMLVFSPKPGETSSRPIMVHRDLLDASCPGIFTILKNTAQPIQDCYTVDMRKESHGIWASYVDWLYHNEFEMLTVNDDFPAQFRMLLNFAQRVGETNFRDALTDCIVPWLNSENDIDKRRANLRSLIQHFWPSALVSRMQESSLEQSTADPFETLCCDLAIDLAAEDGGGFTNLMSKHFTARLLMRSMWRTKQGKVVDQLVRLDALVPCAYHKHAAVNPPQPCYRERKRGGVFRQELDLEAQEAGDQDDQWFERMDRDPKSLPTVSPILMSAWTTSEHEGQP